jgi:exopolyphosphatase/pppGpp-phosphohydrolase
MIWWKKRPPIDYDPVRIANESIWHSLMTYAYHRDDISLEQFRAIGKSWNERESTAVMLARAVEMAEIETNISALDHAEHAVALVSAAPRLMGKDTLA